MYAGVLWHCKPGKEPFVVKMLDYFLGTSGFKSKGASLVAGFKKYLFSWSQCVFLIAWKVQLKGQIASCNSIIG